MPQVCTILGPMRCGTSVLSFSLFKHPEVYGIINLSENIHKKTGFNQGQLTDMYVPMMQVIAQNEPRAKQDKHFFERQTKIVIERNHLPGNLWKTLNGSGFKVLTIIRDPREVILSVLRWHKMPKHNKNNKAEQPWVNGFMNKWMEAITAHRELRKSNDAYLVRHEDLCNSPIEEGGRLFDWLGISKDYLDKFAEGYRDATIRRDDDVAYQKYLTDPIRKQAARAGYEL